MHKKHLHDIWDIKLICEWLITQYVLQFNDFKVSLDCKGKTIWKGEQITINLLLKQVLYLMTYLLTDSSNVWQCSIRYKSQTTFLTYNVSDFISRFPLIFYQCSSYRVVSGQFLKVIWTQVNVFKTLKNIEKT